MTDSEKIKIINIFQLMFDRIENHQKSEGLTGGRTIYDLWMDDLYEAIYLVKHDRITEYQESFFSKGVI